MSSSSWAAVIPAFNAAATISIVVKGISHSIPRENILVVDDGSKDLTFEAAVQTGVEVLHRSLNGGKGAALRDGFAFIQRWEPDWILCLDADGQHDPALIPEFLKAAEKGQVDLIIGDRTADLAAMPYLRRFSNRCSSFLLSLRTGWKLPDVQCGYRAIRKGALERLDLHCDAYDIEVEMILQAWRANLRIAWIPVPTIYQGETSFLRKFPETVRFLKLMLRSFYDR